MVFSDNLSRPDPGFDPELLKRKAFLVSKENCHRE